MFMKHYASNRCEPIGDGRGGGIGGCKPRIEVIVKMEKKSLWGSGWGVRLDVNQELRLLVIVKMKKKVGGGGIPVRGLGQGECKPRIEVIVKMEKVRGTIRLLYSWKH